MAKRKFAGDWKDLKEAQTRFRSFAQIIDSNGRKVLDAAERAAGKRAGIAIQEAYWAAAKMIRDRARSNAAATRAPRRLYTGPKPAIFYFGDFAEGITDSKRDRSVMVGVRTGLSSRAGDGRLYVNWYPRSKRRKKDNSRIGYGGLSMSFGALFERGTQDRRILPRRYFRSAIYATRSAVLRMLANAYRKAADAFNR